MHNPHENRMVKSTANLQVIGKRTSLGTCIMRRLSSDAE